MICDELAAKVLQLYQVENLSMRQIAAYCGMCAKTVSRIIHSEGAPLRNGNNETIIVPYRRLIEAWYGDLPKLKAQVYERLRDLALFDAKLRQRLQDGCQHVAGNDGSLMAANSIADFF